MADPVRDAAGQSVRAPGPARSVVVAVGLLAALTAWASGTGDLADLGRALLCAALASGLGLLALRGPGGREATLAAMQEALRAAARGEPAVARALLPLEDPLAHAVALLLDRAQDERARLEARRAELERELAARASEAVESHDRLRTLDRARDILLSGVSHELRTPLTSVLAAVEILQNYAGEEPIERAEFLRIIDKEARRLLQVIDGILDLAKMEAGTLQLDLATHDLAEIVAEVQADLEPRAREQGIHLRLAGGAARHPCECDRARVRLCLATALESAIFDTPGGATVRVWIESRDGGYEVHVRDGSCALAGPGQVHAARTGTSGGETLRLALAARIADTHGGCLLHGVQPDGSCGFTLRLPAQRGAGAERPLAAAP